MPLRLAAQLSVQQELKLAPQQVQAIGSLREKYRSSRDVLGDTPRGNSDESRRKTDEARRAIDQALAEILRPEQGHRLQQLVLQQRRATSGLLALFPLAEFQAALELSEDQKDRVRQVQLEQANAIQALGFVRNLEERRAEIHKAADEKLLNMLSDAQRAALPEMLKALLGEPFQVPLAQEPPVAGGRGGFGTLLVLGESAAPSLRTLLRQQAVRQELKLTDEQSAKINPLVDRSDRGADAAADAEAIRAILSVEQSQRLEQLRWQYARQRYGPVGVLRYRDVIGAIEPAADQRPKLEALLRQYPSATPPPGADQPADAEQLARTAQEKLAEILTADQQARLKALYGEPFAGSLYTPPRFNPGQGSFAFSPRSLQFRVGQFQAPSRLITDATVRRDLKLTEDQARRIDELARANRSPTAEQLAEILNPPQRERFGQLQLQWIRWQYGPLGLFRFQAPLQALELTPEQQTKIAELGNADRAAASEILRGEAATRTPRLTELDHQAEAAIAQTLTPAQSDKLKALLGEPLAGQFQTPIGTFGTGPGRGDGAGGGRGFNQFALGTNTGALGFVLRFLINDPTTRDHLKLTDEQLPKLQEMLRAMRDTDLAGLADVLEPAQRQRLVELHWQWLRMFAGPAGILRYRAAIDALQPTPEQSEKLLAIGRANWPGSAARFRGTPEELKQLEEADRRVEQQILEVLAPEQRTRWNALFGEKYDGLPRPSFPSGAGDRRGVPAQPQPAAPRSGR